jgi:hypothetical protein
MLSCRAKLLYWLTAFCWIYMFLIITTTICSRSIKFVITWEIVLLRFSFFMRIFWFLRIARFISCVCLKGLSARIKLFIFNSYWLFSYCLDWKFIFILRLTLKWHIFILIFNSGYYFFSHLRFMAWELCLIGWTDITIRLIRLWSYMNYKLL